MKFLKEIYIELKNDKLLLIQFINVIILLMLALCLKSLDNNFWVKEISFDTLFAYPKLSIWFATHLVISIGIYLYDIFKNKKQ